MGETYCNQCGHKNPVGSNFCSSCGAVLEREADGPDTSMITLPAGDLGEEDVGVPVDDFPAGFGMLVVKRGPNAGSRFLLGTQVTTIGRQPDSDIFLDDVTVSRRHAEVTATPAGFVARDVGSLNGTYLNRERMEEATTLSNGDEVQVGKFRLVFLSEVPRAKGQAGG